MLEPKQVSRAYCYFAAADGPIIRPYFDDTNGRRDIIARYGSSTSARECGERNIDRRADSNCVRRRNASCIAEKDDNCRHITRSVLS